MWPIITYVLLGLIMIDIIGFALLSIYQEEKRVSSIIKTKKIIKIAILFEINVVNFLFVFIPTRLVIDLVNVILVNLSGLLYFLWDVLYLSERKKEYILWLQKVVFSDVKLSSVFDIKSDDGGKYIEQKKFSQQRCSIVKQANEQYESIKIEHGSSTYYLVPKQQLSRDTLVFYCLKIDFDLEKEEKLYLYSKDVNPIAIKEYENEGLSKVYL